MKYKIEEILDRYTNSPVAFDDGVERVTFQERYFPISDLVKELSTLIQEERKDLEEYLSKVLKQLEETNDSLMKLYIENDELKIKLKMQNDVKREAVEGFIDYVSQLELPKEGIDILSVEGLRIVNELLFRKVEEYLESECVKSNEKDDTPDYTPPMDIKYKDLKDIYKPSITKSESEGKK